MKKIVKKLVLFAPVWLFAIFISIFIGIITFFYPTQLCILTAILCILLVLWFLLKTMDIFSPTVGFLSAYFIYYGIGMTKIFTVHGVETPLKLWNYIILGAVCISIGILTARCIFNRKYWTSNKHKRDIEKQVNIKRAKKVVIFMFLWGMLFLGSCYIKAGIPLLAPLFSQRPYLVRIALYRYTSPYVHFQWYFLFVCCILSFFIFCRLKKSFFLYFSLLIIAIYTMNLTRGVIIRLSIMCIVLYHFFRKKIDIKRLFLGIGIVILIGGYFLSLRGATEYGTVFKNAYTLCRTTTESFAKIIEVVPTNVDFFKGYLHFGSWIELLPGHQPSAGLLISQKIMGYSDAEYGTTPSFIGGLYLDGGIVGVFLGCFIVGLVLEFLYQKAKSDKDFYFFYTFIFVMSLTLLYSGGIIFFSVRGVWLLMLMKVAFDYAIKGRLTQIDRFFLIPVIGVYMIIGLVMIPLMFL